VTVTVVTPPASVRDLRVAYTRAGRETQALRGVSLELRPGRVLALAGESGSGKSTLGLALLGLLPRNARIAGGEILVDGRDLAHAAEDQWRAVRGRRIAMHFQDAQAALDPTQPIGEQVAEGPRLADGLGRAEARERALVALRDVGLPDAERVYTSFPHELSGGMRQRALFAVAVARDPAALVADEPTSALDPTLQLRILELLRARARARGTAILWITHDLASAAFAADEIAVLHAGRIVERAPAERLVRRPKHPYTVALLAATLAREGAAVAPEPHDETPAESDTELVEVEPGHFVAGPWRGEGGAS
jgi:peptide/nickel transport system ATP-binding protein